MSHNQGRLDEQALDKAVEIGIKSQLDQAEAVDVDIKTNPLKVIQGQVDSVSVNGKGIVMQQNLRAEEIQVQTSNVAVDPLRTALGKIELKQPTDATARVVLTEQDINQAFNAAIVQEKLQGLEVRVDGQPVTINTQQVRLSLPGQDQVALTAQVHLQETDQQKEVCFKTTPKMSSDGQRISLDNVEYAEGKELSPELTQALLDKASEIMDLRTFEMEGMDLRLKGFDIQQGRLTLQAEARISKFAAS